MPTVFISYRHEDPDHGLAVLGFADALRKAGATVLFDQFVQGTESPDGPSEGWPLWSQRNAREADRVLAINSPGWFSAWTGNLEPTAGLGCAAEVQVLCDRLYKAANKNAFLRLVTLEGRPTAEAPDGLAGYPRFAWPENADGLKAWLRLPTSAPGWPIEPPKWTWGVVANHQHARQAVAKLLTADGGRLLRIVADSAFGKSTFLDDVDQNAASLSWLRSGRIDLSNPSEEQNAVDGLCDRLGVIRQHGETASRLSGMMEALNRRGHPTLILFDTYEKASGSVRSWFDLSLPHLLQGEVAVRVVVAGQRVPATAGFHDGQRDAPIVRLNVPSVEDWFKLAQDQNPFVQALDPVEAWERFEAFVAPLVERTANPIACQGLLPVIAAYALRSPP